MSFGADVEQTGAEAERQTEAGYDEVTCPTPAVVSVTAGVVEPRYPSFKGIMAAKRTAELVPLCHPLALTKVSVELEPRPEQQSVYCRARRADDCADWQRATAASYSSAAAA